MRKFVRMYGWIDVCYSFTQKLLNGYGLRARVELALRLFFCNNFRGVASAVYAVSIIWAPRTTGASNVPKKKKTSQYFSEIAKVKKAISFYPNKASVQKLTTPFDNIYLF